MGSTPSNSKYTNCELYKTKNHCCLEHCFDKIKNVKQLMHISNILWYFNQKHEKELREFLTKLQLDDITQVIMSFLENYASSENAYSEGNNYNAYIRTAVSVLNDNDNNKVCPIWLQYAFDHCPSYKQNKMIKCVMLGGGGVGKSTLTIKFILDQFLDEYDPTIEDSYIKQFALNVDTEDIDKYIHDEKHCGEYKSEQDKEIAIKYKDRQQITLDILDTAGREEFSAMQDQWIRDGRIFFLVFNVMQQDTFDEIQIIWERIKRCMDPGWNEQHNKTNFAVIAVGNKCDLRYDSNWKPYRGRSVVDMKKANQWFKQTQIPYIETSAKTGKNVNFLFRHSIYEYWVQSHSGCVIYD